jgi:2-keto-4-pentenoate hydratase/2-oxohepta-3-ene-1,7-dioic acid hydratase in catechol pathway
MLDLIDAGEAALDGARDMTAKAQGEDDLWRALSDVRLRSPLPEPRQMRDFSVFPGHLVGAPAGMAKLVARIEGRAPEPAPAGGGGQATDVFRRRPIYYKCNRLTVGGHDDDVLWPRYSQYMDYELEFGVVIGRTGVDIPVAEARSHIFGYTIFNDFSARDAQRDEMASRFGPAKGKDFDTGNVLGPWIVTPDELTNPYDLRMQARVNGEVWSDGRSDDMIHSFEDMIAFVSRDETLHGGEFLGSGTIGGGCGMELDRYLEHGDVVELEVDGIGVLRNRVLRKDKQ